MRLCSAFALSGVLTSSPSALAEPWLAPGDSGLRSDLLTLSDAAVLNVPVTTWPLPWADIAAAVTDSRELELAPDVAAALERVRRRARLETRTGEWSVDVHAAVAEKPRIIRTFEDTLREDGSVGGGLAITGDWLAVRLNVARVANPVDGDEVRLDGSYFGVAAGNWMLSVGYPERWWGPGWDGSLILSTNARPTPQIAFNRNVATPFEQRWLRWLGPWSLTSFIGELDDERFVDGARLLGMRFSAKPLPTLEFALSRTAQFCGDARPCDADSFVNLLLGRDNRGVNVGVDEEPGNQLGGFDVRWAPARLPLAFYWQWIGEDTRQGGPQIGSWLRQAGVEYSGLVFGERWRHRSYLEVVDTMCTEGGGGFGGDKPDCAYEHGIYLTGYRYLGRSLGHGLDGDGSAVSAGSVLARDGREWQFLARRMDVNRVGNPSTTHTLSATPLEIAELAVTHRRALPIGAIRAGLGYQRLRDTQNPGRDANTWSGWLEFVVNADPGP